MTIVANDLKTKGVAALAAALEKEEEAVITVRGKPAYVVTSIEHYEYLRECELDQAYARARQEMAEGKARTVTAEEHLRDLQDAL